MTIKTPFEVTFCYAPDCVDYPVTRYETVTLSTTINPEKSLASWRRFKTLAYRNSHPRKNESCIISRIVSLSTDRVIFDL